MIKPQRLEKGDTVATVSLSWGGPAAFPQRYRAGKAQLEAEFGLKVVEMPSTLRSAEWLQQNPKARADDLNQAFSDATIKGIISTIGGDDSIRILPYLDLNTIRTNPKVFMGFSDTTTSHMACYKAGLVTFYGPAIMAGFGENGGLFPYMVDAVRRTLFSSQPISRINPNTQGWTAEQLEWGDPINQSIKRNLQPCTGWKFLQGSGVHHGHLLGGCFDVLDWLRGTQFWLPAQDWQGAILFLETSEEAPPPSTVLRGLRSLAAMGILHQINGLIFGRPGGNISPQIFEQYDNVILQVVKDEQGLNELPIVTHMDFGHTDPIFVLPYGLQAVIDCTQQTFMIPENAVID
ncbi:MAG TPA: LD-carboxypeptidase [Anaerolineaceae bacterium]|nr:LD-carboxypeptidase [Anaerolineaceae bacterium]